MSDIVESVKEVVEQINKRGLKGDVFGLHKRQIDYSIMKGEITDSSENEDFGLGIRVIKDGRIGFGYCVPGKEEAGVKRALSLSPISQKIDIALPDGTSTPSVKKYDEELEDAMMGGQGAEFTQQLIDGVSSVKNDITATRGDMGASITRSAVANTNGLLFEETGSGIYGSTTATIQGEETSQTASELDVSRRLDVNFSDIGHEAGRKVDSMRDTAELTDMDVPVIMDQKAMGMLIYFGLLQGFNGENVRKGKSVFKGELGEEIAKESISLVDDPTKDWGVGSGGFDDEGVPSSKVPMIEDGVLKNFMYDLKEAEKSGVESTGHGLRPSFKSPPGISDRNMILKGEGLKRNELFQGEAIFVDGVMGAHTANAVSGDFSVVANPVWLVEDGEKKGRLDGIMVSGNLTEVIKDFKLADDLEKFYMTLGGMELKMELPTARLESVTVSGK